VSIRQASREARGADRQASREASNRRGTGIREARGAERRGDQRGKWAEWQNGEVGETCCKKQAACRHLPVLHLLVMVHIKPALTHLPFAC
jgi:hypothetical protein